MNGKNTETDWRMESVDSRELEKIEGGLFFLAFSFLPSMGAGYAVTKGVLNAQGRPLGSALKNIAPR